MKQKRIKRILLFICVIGFFANMKIDEVYAQDMKAKEIVIALDPGHDKKHAGATRDGIHEEILTLKIAKYCKEELENKYGVKVHMTREDAACPYPNTGKSGECIEQRMLKAKSEGATIYVSMHLNASVSNKVNGAEVIYPNNNWKPQIGKNGKALADDILEELGKIGLAKRENYYKNTSIDERYPDGSYADYYTVQISGKKNDIPGVIIEHAFLSNASDVKNFLNTEEGLKKLGVADAKGIAKFLNLSEGRWELDETGWKYRLQSGYVTNQWKWISGQKYYFDENGYMVTGWLDDTYYLGSNGNMYTGWKMIDGSWYYFNTDGKKQTGWKYIKGTWYYMDAEGIMQTGWLELYGSKFYLQSSGAAVTGWQTIDEKKYYFDKNCYLLTGKQTINKNVYYLDEITGELHPEGWVYQENTWSYYDFYGKKVTGWKYIRGAWYYMDKEGIMQTGWLELYGSKFYLKSSGAAVTGWQTIDDKKYYFDQNCYLLTGKRVIDKKVYYLDELTGELHAKGWEYQNDTWSYYEADGKKVTGWKYIRNFWYYMDSEGIMQTGWLYDGRWYYLEDSGAWIPKNRREGTYKLLGKSAVSVEQMIKFYQENGATYPAETLIKGGAPDIETFCQIYYEEATAEGIAVEVAFAQAMKETNWLCFDGEVCAEQFNFAGIKTADQTGTADFSTYESNGVRMGIRAQIQHLKACADSNITEKKLANPCIDPSFGQVKKGTVTYVEWLGQKENPQGFGWTDEEEYGFQIADMIYAMK